MKLLQLDEKTKAHMSTLESVLIVHFRPTFLHVTAPDTDGDIQIIISANKFKFMNIQARISEIFKLLDLKCPDILKERLIVIQAFSGDQMEDILESVFNEKV